VSTTNFNVNSNERSVPTKIVWTIYWLEVLYDPKLILVLAAIGQETHTMKPINIIGPCGCLGTAAIPNREHLEPPIALIDSAEKIRLALA